MLYYIRSTGFSRQNDPVARAVFHGKRGELRQQLPRWTEVQLGAVGLMVNIIVLWTRST